MEFQDLLNILIYIFSGLIFLNALRNDLEFHTFYSLIVAIAFALWFLFVRTHPLSLYAAAVMLVLGYLISIIEKSEYDSLRKKLNEVIDDIKQRSGFKIFPPVIFPTPKAISRMFAGVSARKLYNGYKNAFAMADNTGKPFMVVMPALVRNFSKNAIVFVIAHELGHILLGHLYDAVREREGKLGSILGGILGGIGGALVGGLLGGWFGAIVGAGVGGLEGMDIGEGLFVVRYSRKQELEADAFAALLMEDMGYDLSGIVEFMEYADAVEPRGFFEKLWSSHPPAVERLSHIRKTLENREKFARELNRKINLNYLRG